MTKIAVGSRSVLKIQATQQAFPGATVEGVDTASGVPDQPCGREQTLKGAHNRANGARAAVPDADKWIAYENGMVRNEDGTWIDLAAIVVVERLEGSEQVRTAEIWSDVLPIPPEAVAALTFDANGEPDRNWSPLKDPHLELSGRSRVSFLADAITSWLATRDA